MPYIKTYSIMEMKTRLETIIINTDDRIIKHEAEKTLALLPALKGDRRNNRPIRAGFKPIRKGT